MQNTGQFAHSQSKHETPFGRPGRLIQRDGRPKKTSPCSFTHTAREFQTAFMLSRPLSRPVNAPPPGLMRAILARVQGLILDLNSSMARAHTLFIAHSRTSVQTCYLGLLHKQTNKRPWNTKRYVIRRDARTDTVRLGSWPQSPRTRKI